MSNQHNLEAFGDAGIHPIWYHGKINRGNVEGILKGKPEGAFMIRDSGSSPGDYVLSLCEGTRVSHYIIQKGGPHSYVLSDQTFVNIVELINFYRVHLLDSTCLTVPVPETEALKNGVRIKQFLVIVRAKHNFNGRDPEDLSFHKGELLNVIEKHEPEWWKAQSQETLQIGVVPANYLEFIEDGPIEVAAKEVQKAKEERLRIQNKPLPPPPKDLEEEKRRKDAEDERIRAAQAAEAAKMAKRKAERERKADLQRKADELARKRADEVQRLQQEHQRAENERMRREKEAFDAQQRALAEQVDREFNEAETKRVSIMKAALNRPNFCIACAQLDRLANVYDKSALTFRNTDFIHVKKQNDNGLWDGSVVNGRRKGRRGHFPFTFVEIVEPRDYNDDIKKIEKEFKIAELKKAGVDIEGLLRAGQKKKLQQSVFEFQSKAAPVLPELPPVVLMAEEEDMYKSGSDSGGEDYEETDPSNMKAPPPVVRRNAPPVPEPRGGGGGGRRPPPSAPVVKKAALPPPETMDDIYGEMDEDDIYGGTAELFDDSKLEEAMEEIYGSL
eukprot:m.48324 g.48324  ORF g.48324 m.48324 type:complete len:558 (+) comp20708_c0_seq1:201-1874(+)